MRKSIAVTGFFLLFSLMISNSYAFPLSGFTENWDDGSVDGWTANTIQGTTTATDNSGNPLGYLYAYDMNATSTWDIGAQSHIGEVSGDFTGTSWIISFDVNFMNGTFDNAWLRYRNSISSNGWVYDFADSFTTGWNTYSIEFDPNWSNDEAKSAGWTDWTGGGTSWVETMSQVYYTEIRISGTGPVEAGIDNFSQTAVPEPTTMLLLVTGLAGLAGFRRKLNKN